MTRDALALELAAILHTTPDDLPGVFQTPAVRLLAIGAFDDLMERYPDAPRNRLQSWFRRWTGLPAYRRALKRGAWRYSLDGTPIALAQETSDNDPTYTSHALRNADLDGLQSSQA